MEVKLGQVPEACHVTLILSEVKRHSSGFKGTPCVRDSLTFQSIV